MQTDALIVLEYRHGAPRTSADLACREGEGESSEETGVLYDIAVNRHPTYRQSKMLTSPYTNRPHTHAGATLRLKSLSHSTRRDKGCPEASYLCGGKSSG